MTLAARLAIAAAMVARALAAADEPAPDVCAAVSAAVTLDQVAMAGQEVTAKGTWSVVGNAPGVVVEYRIDSDRMAAEVRLGASGTWEARIGGKLCGQHYFRVTALPLAPDGARQEVCLAKPGTALREYAAECVAPVALSDCEWDCKEGPDAACVGRCLGSVAAPDGSDFVPQLRLEGVLFKSVDAASPGPWWVSLSCKLDQPVAFRVREASGRRKYSLPVEIVCGR